MTTPGNQHLPDRTNGALTFLLDTNLRLPTDQRPWKDILAAAGITAKQSTDFVYIDEELASHNPDIAYIPAADFHPTCRFRLERDSSSFCHGQSRSPGVTHKQDPKMSTESKEQQPDKDKIEEREVKVVPEGTFGGSIEKPTLVKEGEPIAEDTGDQGGGQN